MQITARKIVPAALNIFVNWDTFSFSHSLLLLFVLCISLPLSFFIFFFFSFSVAINFHSLPFFLSFLPLFSTFLSPSLFLSPTPHPVLFFFFQFPTLFFLSVCWQPCAMLTTASCWVTTPHTRTHTLPRGVRACYSDNAADKTNNRQIYKNGLKCRLILGDFHISAALINPVFRHACRFRKTRGARKINRLNYNRKFWSHSSPNSTGTFVTGLKIDVRDHSEPEVPKNVLICSHRGCRLSFGSHFSLVCSTFPTFFRHFKQFRVLNLLSCLEIDRARGLERERERREDRFCKRRRHS